MEQICIQLRKAMTGQIEPCDGCVSASKDLREWADETEREKKLSVGYMLELKEDELGVLIDALLEYVPAKGHDAELAQRIVAQALEHRQCIEFI